MNKIPLIVIAGPTASGKTALSIEVAKRLNSEIVACDSMQIYKYMNIGTAKPTVDEQKACKHHLIDFVDPSENFSVAQYANVCHLTIEGLHKKGIIPVMVGGTGLYINSVVDDIIFNEVEIDLALRNELEALANEKGVEHLHKMLFEIDEVSANKIHQNDVKRVIRAIEVYKTTGMTMTEQNEKSRQNSRYNVAYFAIDFDRELLYNRINIRVDMMVNDGLIDEVKRLLELGYSEDTTAMQAIGYKEVVDHLKGNTSYDEMVDIIKQSTRRYAKRQLTWFRRDKRIVWLKPEGDMVGECLRICKDKFGE